MECGLCGAPRPSLRCNGCGVIAYCSSDHQELDWSVHESACERMLEQAKRAAMFDDFPFSYMEELRSSPICSFLQNRGLHEQGLWSTECQCVPRSETFGRNSSWHLKSNLCPCRDPVQTLAAPLRSWSEYYMWRRLPLNSPTAIVLHWPLTLYYSISLASERGFHVKETLNVHYLGPEKELNQVHAFAELLALFPNTHLRIHFVGPAVPSSRHRSTLHLNTYLKCLDSGCDCNEPGTRTGRAVVVKFWKGLYHKLQHQIPSPDFVFAANAGIPGFPSWRPTIECLLKLKVPVLFSDYCEEACVLSIQYVDSVESNRVSFPITMNQFRKPAIPSSRPVDLPIYSNCCLFGLM